MRDLFCARNDMTEECVFAFMNETGQPRCGMPNGQHYATQRPVHNNTYRNVAIKSSRLKNCSV
jgi:hypothetical protein